MLPDHFSDLLAAVRRKVADVPQVFAEYERAGLSAKRLRWDLCRAAIGDKGICAFYRYLDDEHIDTALRQVMQRVAP